MNAAETWVDITHDELKIDSDAFMNQGAYIDYVSESGKMEFFIFGSTLNK
jgi:hypothetical protein